MANMVSNMLKVPELRKRVFFTLMCLVVYRIGCHITTPGINPLGLKELFDELNKQAIGSLLSYIDLFAGGAFEKFTIFGLGIMPYITVSIVMQLLTTIIPHLEQLSKEGELGRRKIQQYTRYGTILICAVQSGVISRWMVSHEGVVAASLQGHSFYFTSLVVVTVTTGTVFLMWLGDQISERGIGNGISLIIFAGIAARIPYEFRATWEKVQLNEVNPVGFILILLIFAAVIFFVVYEQEGQRRIPVQFARKVVGRKMYGSQSTYIPFKINPTGVIPIIFASAMVMVPSQLAQMLGDKYPNVATVAATLSPGHVPYMIVYSLLIIFFAYVYTTIQFNPVDIAENLKKQGGYIPGIRPGIHTQEYLYRVLMKITFAGSMFLALIAIFPDILLKLEMFSDISPGFVYLMGGTSLLILVAVDLDTMKQIESQLVMREYEGFMSKKGRRHRRRK